MSSRSRGKLFIENFLIYGLGGAISKLVPLIMLPILTRLYPNAEYIGLNDLSNTFISFASALAVCGMYDAMFRLFFDDKKLENQKMICSTSLIFVTGLSILLAAIGYFFRVQIAQIYFGDTKYEGLVVLTLIGFLLSATNQIVSAPTRIQNKRAVFLVTNTLSPIISYAVAIPLVLQGYYVIAMPLATIVSALTIEIAFLCLNHKFFTLSGFNKRKLIELLLIGLPLMPNFLVYWIYNSADKVMITQILNNQMTGIYSVASRIGHISNLIYTAFSGGWLYFAYSTMKDDDQVKLKSNIFEYVSAISYISTAILMLFSKLGFQLLFSEEYLQGYIVAPYLFLSPLLLMMFQVIANQFTIIKKTYLNLLSLAAGALLNLLLNSILIPIIGIEGAAIATTIGYIVSITICALILIYKNLLYINKRFLFSSAIMIIYYFLWRFFLNSSLLLNSIALVVMIAVYVLLYKAEIKLIVKKVFRRI